jgi:hypothetical protein
MSSITNQIGDGKARPSVGRCQAEARSTHKERRLDTPRVFLYKGKLYGNQIQASRGHTMTAMKFTGHKSEQMHRRYNTIQSEDLYEAAAKRQTYTAHTVITLASSAVSGQGVRGCHSNVGA